MTTQKIITLQETIDFFSKITTLLKEAIPNQVTINSASNKCTITPFSSSVSQIWIKLDIPAKELIVGRGFFKEHFSVDKDEITKGFTTFIDHLIIKQRRIDYFLGNSIYQSDYEIYRKGNGYVKYGTVEFANYNTTTKKRKKTISFDPILNKREHKTLLKNIHEL